MSGLHPNKSSLSPQALSSTAIPTIHGYIAPGYEAVRDQFTSNLRRPDDLGGAFSAVVDGATVVDLWGGIADPQRGVIWQEDTVAGILSGTKGLVAICLLKLIETGRLALDEAVATYWPEFAQNGKQDISVRQLVSHQAGLPGIEEPISPQEATNCTHMAELLSRQAPICRPGTQLYYHALSFGWLCGELVRRIDGRSVGRFFAEEVAAPLHLDIWVGLPEREKRRVATTEIDQALAIGSGIENADSLSEQVRWSIWENPQRYTGNPLPVNSAYWQEAEVPGSSGIGSARSLARLYGCLARGGELDGVRVLQPETINLGQSVLSIGLEPFIGKTMAFGVGFQLQTKAQPFGPAEAAFGHTGAGGSVHGAWPNLRCGFSFVTNKLMGSADADQRVLGLLTPLFAAVEASNHS
ncbi:serine hydrolase domain-containing protein [Pelagibacterium sp.]|uniref:serine hydrolase domain-containing protein n=1 Tax=Pelagibacterium sp. TaxID=1967288 RepID=UPI003BAA3564